MFKLELGKGDTLFSWNSMKRRFYFNTLRRIHTPGAKVNNHDCFTKTKYFEIEVTDVRSLDVLITGLKKFREHITLAHLPPLPDEYTEEFLETNEKES